MASRVLFLYVHKVCQQENNIIWQCSQTAAGSTESTTLWADSGLSLIHEKSFVQILRSRNIAVQKKRISCAVGLSVKCSQITRKYILQVLHHIFEFPYLSSVLDQDIQFIKSQTTRKHFINRLAGLLILKQYNNYETFLVILPSEKTMKWKCKVFFNASTIITSCWFKIMLFSFSFAVFRWWNHHYDPIETSALFHWFFHYSISWEQCFIYFNHILEMVTPLFQMRTIILKSTVKSVSFVLVHLLIYIVLPAIAFVSSGISCTIS